MSFRSSLSIIPLLIACDSDKGVTAFNSKPEASITSHSDGDAIQEGYLQTFRGSASDANHSYDELTATWYVGSEVLCDAIVPESDGLVQCEGILTPADTVVTLEVKDAGNATGSASVNLTVEPTAAPESLILTPESSGVYYSDQLITFTGVLSDAEDSPETLTGYWASNLGGTLSDVEVTPNAEGEIEGFGYLTEGEHAIQLHVEDSTGKTGTSSVVIDVGPPNTAPLCEILSPVTGSAGPEGDLVTFTATASDVDVPSDWLSVSWSSDKDGALGNSTPNSSGEISFPYEDLSINTHVISMVVTDELGETCTADVIYTVGTPPSLTVISPIQNEIYAEGSPITFEATASDNENQPTSIGLIWDVDGTVISTTSPDSTGVARFDDSSLTAGSHTLTVTATDSDGLYATDVVSFSVNGVPNAPTVEISPDPVYTTDTLTANASGSVDPEGSAVNYSFVWLQNGQVTTHTTATVQDTATSKNETWTVRVTPDDGVSEGAFTETTVVILNTAPTVTNVAISPSTLSNSDSLTCSYTITDPDETPTTTVQWTNDTTGVVLGSSDTLTLSSSTASVNDTITCEVTATDSDGATHTSSATASVSNRPPVIASVTIDPSAADNADTLTCLVNASDADGDSLTTSYAWSNVTTGAALGSSDTLVLDSSIAAPTDLIQCIATVDDGNNGIISALESITIDNTTPTLSNVTITPSTALTDSVLSCSGTASDADGDAITTSYEWHNGSNILGYTNTLTLNNTLAAPSDSITCTITVSDPYGATVSDSVSVIVDNMAPTVDSVTISPSTAVHGDTLTCLGTASDDDGGSPTLSYAWTLNGNTVSTTDTLTLSNAIDGDAVVCTVTATDADGGSDTGSDSLTVDNTAPTTDSVSISPSSITSQTLTVTCSATGSDVDNDNLTYSYEWLIDSQSQTETSNMLSGPFNVGSLIACRSTSNDGKTDGNTLEDSAVVENTDPNIDSISINPDSGITTTSSLSCDVSASDVDGGTPALTYEWTVSGNVVGSAMQLSLTPSIASPSDSVTCTATATDSDGGTVSDSTVVTVENSTPVFTANASITPQSGVYTDTSVSCAAVATDIDDGSATLSYVWTNGGNAIGTGPVLAVNATNSDVGDTLTCEVTATDNDGGTASSADSVVVENTAPSVTSTAITPNTGVTTAATLSCSGLATDIDGEPTTTAYQWTNQTQATNLGSGSTLTLTPSTVSPGDTVQCTVTATDPHGASDSADVSVSVDNTDPSIDSIGISPNSGVTTTTSLSCDVSASDADGGSLTTVYQWTVNSNVVGSAMQLDLTPSMASPSDTVTCTATVTDGSGGTASGSAAVTVENSDPVFSADASITPDSGVVTGTVLSCSAVGTDVDDGSATLSYVWMNGSNTIGSGQALTVSTSNSDVGDTLTCEVTATDSDGGTSSSTDTVIVENTAPSISNAAITPNGGVVTYTVLTCAGQSTDNDGESVTTTYEWTNQTQASDLGSGGILILSSSTVAPGDTVQCTVTATDPHGASDSIDLTVDVENTDPVVTSVTLTPTSGVQNGDQVACSATSNDVDGSAVTMSYSWTINGNSAGTGASITLNSAIDGDVVECTATAVDADGGMDQDTANLTVENSAPVATSVVLTPANPTSQTSSLTCTASGSDSDGDSVSFNYEWLIDGQVQSETSNMLSGSFVVGNQIVCQATPTDGKDDGTPVGDNVAIENTPPVIDSVSLSPSTAYTNDTITATATASDVDNGQSLSIFYEWHVIDFDTGIDSVPSSGYGIVTFNGFSRDDEVYVIVTVNDNIDHSSPVTSNSITISNSAPSAPVVSLSPDPAIEGQDDLTCVVSVPSSDDDGDAVVYTYVWTDDSGSVQQTTVESSSTSDVFSAADTSEGTWTCEVTANDGTDVSGSDSASVTVEPACPAGGDGLSVDCPAMDCAQILADGYSTGDGTYWIDPVGNGAFEVHCDMTTDGGGWTYVARGSSFSSNTDSAFGNVQTDPDSPNKWHFSAATIQAIVGNTLPYESYTTMGINGDSSSNDFGQYRVRLENDFMTFTSPMYNFSAWDGTNWIGASTTGDMSHLGPSWVTDSSNVCCEVDTISGDWANCYQAPSNIGAALWSQGNANQHLRCSNDTTVQNGLLLYVRKDYSDSDADGYAAWEDCDDNDANAPSNDADCDGFATIDDCDDNDPTVYPYAGDTYGDGVDSDCDGLDCEAASDGSTYFAACPAFEDQSNAKTRCISAGYDGLAELHSATENSFFLNLISWSTDYNYWLGLERSGSWSWNSGTPYTYSDWAPFEPNNTGNCLMMWGPGGMPYANKWNDVWCTNIQDGPQGIGASCQRR